MKSRPLAQFSDYGVEYMATTVPGWRAGTSRLNTKDKNVMVFGLPDRVMVSIYEQIQAPLAKYLLGVWDCENIARWYAAKSAELWARLVQRGEAPEGCLFQGVVFGRIPVGSLPAGNHAANFFINDKNQYRMYEGQLRRLLTPEEVAKTEQTWELEVH